MVEYIVNNKLIRVNVFDKIRDSFDAYFLGYLFCDGAYAKATHKRNHRMAVSSTDVEIIDAFVEHYQPTSDPKLRDSNNNLDKGIIGRKKYKNLVLSSKFSPYLESFGVMCLKIDRVYQNIPKKFFIPFLLGCFDADGSISWGHRKDRNRLWANFTLTHASLGFLTKIQKQLHDDFSISTFVFPKGKDKCFVLRVSDRNEVAKLFNILYSSKPPIFNTRKYKHYNSYVEELKA